MKRLEPIGDIGHRRRYRTTRLYVAPPEVSTRPPHPALLRYEKKTEEDVAREELSGLRRTIKLCKNRVDEEWKDFFRALTALVDTWRIRGTNPEKFFDVLREVHRYLESHERSRDVWKTLRVIRHRSPHGLDSDQRERLRELLSRHPDLLLVTGNQFVLLLLVALEESGISEPSASLVESLWEYMVPWQLVTLGFTPHYNSRHRTGKSVLHRTQILNTLVRRARATSRLIEQSGVSEVLFGRAIPVRQDSLSGLWLVFQSRVGSHEMSASLISPTTEISENPVQALRNLPRERPYWGETDLSRLQASSKGLDIQSGTSILIAQHQGVRGLWVYEKGTWSPVGRFEYYTRKKEAVTLLQSFIIEQDSSMRVIGQDEVRRPPDALDDNIETALGIIDAVYRGCLRVKCKVSLDEEEEKFRVEFSEDADGSNVTGHLLVARTKEILELVRRPDFECEPVVVDGKKLVWNRFRDIKYNGDSSLLRPWVERADPFKTKGLTLPSTAKDLLDARRSSGLKFEVYHETSICPLVRISTEEIEKKRKTIGKDIESQLRGQEDEPGLPSYLMNESIHSHGMCWRVRLQDSDSLPENFRKLEKIVFSGYALGAILRTGSLVHRHKDEWMIHEFDVPRSEDLPVEFRECVALVDAYRSIVPQALREMVVPGSYRITSEQLWRVSINLRRGEGTWSAMNLHTSQIHGGTSYSIILHPGASLEDELKHILLSITARIKKGTIIEFDRLREGVVRRLRDLGYPSEYACELKLQRTDDKLEYEVYLTETGEFVALGNVTISEDCNVEDTWSELMSKLDRKGLSMYHFVNEAESWDELHRILTEIAAESGRQLGESVTVSSIDLWTLSIEFTRMKEEFQDLLKAKETEGALRVVESAIVYLTGENVSADDARELLIEALALRAKVMTSEGRSPSPQTLLETLDRMHGLIIPGSVYLRASSPFGKLVRWALALRDKLRKRL